MDTISVEDLRDYFECPICLCVPNAPPIYQCGRGHLICSTCRPKVAICPICRTRMPHDSRLLFAERLLEERLPIPCKFSDDGCTILMVSSQIRIHEGSCQFSPVPCSNASFGCRATQMTKLLKEHLEKCDYRRVRCPMLKCDAEILFKQMEGHLREGHFGGGRLSFPAKLVLVLLAVCLLSVVVNILLLMNI